MNSKPNEEIIFNKLSAAESDTKRSWKGIISDHAVPRQQPCATPEVLCDHIIPLYQYFANQYSLCVLGCPKSSSIHLPAFGVAPSTGHAALTSSGGDSVKWIKLDLGCPGIEIYSQIFWISQSNSFLVTCVLPQNTSGVGLNDKTSANKRITADEVVSMIGKLVESGSKIKNNKVESQTSSSPLTGASSKKQTDKSGVHTP